MLTLYPERRKLKRISRDAGNSRWFSPADRRFVPAAFVALALVLCPWPPDWYSHFSKTRFGELPGLERILRDETLPGNDAFSNVIVHLRSYRKAIRNARYLTVIDYSKPSNLKRMYLIDMETGGVEKYLVSHGRNSGWRYATAFSNQPESFQSCRGFFTTGRKYIGRHGTALQLHGLEKGVNDNAFRRGIVMHGADYVSVRAVKLNGGRLGRSLGCPAIPAEEAESVIDRIKGGSLVYIHTGRKFGTAEGLGGQ